MNKFLFRGIMLSALLFQTVTLSCSQKGEANPIFSQSSKSALSHARLDYEYRSLVIKLNLAKTKQPYLVLDFRWNKVTIMLGGTAIWDTPMNYVSLNPGKLESFSKRFLGTQNQFVRRLQEKFLYSAEEKIPDSILTVVANALEMDPDLLQRDLPRKFRLQWKGTLILEVQTDITGSPKAVLKNLFADIQRKVLHPMENTTIVISMPPEDALTLYRAASKGMNTLIIPPAADSAFAANLPRQSQDY